MIEITLTKKDFEDYHDFLKLTKARGTTQVYTNVLRNFSKVGPVYTRQTVIDFIASAKTTTATKASVLSIIKAFLAFLKIHRGLEGDVLLQLMIRRPKPAMGTTLSEAEAEALLIAGKSESLQNAMLIELLYCTGVRVSEGLSIRLKHIDMFERSIKVLGKGGKERMVIFGQRLHDLLKLSQDANPNLDFLVTKKDKKTPIAVASVQVILTRCAKKANITKRVTPHALRRSFATHLFNSGGSSKVAQQLLGHTKLRTTQSYVNLDEDRLRESVRKLYTI